MDKLLLDDSFHHPPSQAFAYDIATEDSCAASSFGYFLSPRLAIDFLELRQKKITDYKLGASQKLKDHLIK